MTHNEMCIMYPGYTEKERLLREQAIDAKSKRANIQNEPAADHYSGPALTPVTRVRSKTDG